MTDALWTVQDIADYLRISKRSAYNIVANPGFPQAVRIGQPRWYQSEVEAWVKSKQERRAA